MTRARLSPARAALLLLSALLLVLTLTARKPGTPPTLKADEPAYYLGALSLAYDFDFRADPRDLGRAFEDYPYAPIDNLIVMSSDGWRTLYYGKPYSSSACRATRARRRSRSRRRSGRRAGAGPSPSGSSAPRPGCGFQPLC
jgi:hypothetical protein